MDIGHASPRPTTVWTFFDDAQAMLLSSCRYARAEDDGYPKHYSDGERLRGLLVLRDCYRNGSSANATRI